MTYRLQLLQHLLDVNRTLEELRDHATKAFVFAEAEAIRLDEKQGNEAGANPASERWWKLREKIQAFRNQLYDEKLDDELVALVWAAMNTEVEPA